MTDADAVQKGWDAQSRIARVTRIEAQIRLIDALEGELRRAKLAVTCLARRVRDLKWELSRLTVNLAILAPPPVQPPAAANGHQVEEPAPIAAKGRRKRKGADHA